MFASLPMYDLPEVKDATDTFWQSLTRHLGLDASPLTRTVDWSSPWRDSSLFFSQTCGYPFTHAYRGLLTYVATPCYRADGCDGASYRSILFARELASISSFKNKVAAFNNRDSMSGMLALKLVFCGVAEQGNFFSSALETGSHVASLAAVQNGQADVCAIDCVTVALLSRYRPSALRGLVEVARSPLVPGLPFVTRSADVLMLQNALHAVFADAASKAARDALLLDHVAVLRANDYDIILDKESRMQEAGGLELWPDGKNS